MCNTDLKKEKELSFALLNNLYGGIDVFQTTKQWAKLNDVFG